MPDVGFAPMQMEARPPYIRFERRAVEKRKSDAEGGMPYYEDVDFALVTPHGSRDTTEKRVDEWFPQLQEQIRQGRFPPTWLDAYKAGYAAYKNDQEPPLNGQSIKMWPAISPAETKILLNLRVLTVEDMAEANEELLQRVGMGARSLKQRAQDWLKAQTGHAPLIAQMDSLRQLVEGLKNQVTSLTEANQQLRADLAGRNQIITNAVHDGLPPLEDRLVQAKLAADRSGPSDDALISDSINEVLQE